MSLVDKFMNLIRQHEEYRLDSCINLRADENYSSAQVRQALGSDLANRNTSPDPRLVYRGTKYLSEAADMTIELGKKLFNSDYINIWAPTGHTANLITFFAFCKPGDKILVVAPEHGGYSGMAKDTLPRCLGLETLYFPFDYEKMNIDIGSDKTAKIIETEKPSLIVLGATSFLFPPPIQEIAQVANRFRIPVAYDGSHVLGLIAGGQFQDPLREGVDMLFGSTMKTLGGPPGGILLTNSKEIHDKMYEVTSYNAITNKQQNRIVALGIRFAEMLENGKDYAIQVVQNAKALAVALEKQGIEIMCREKGYTSSHILLLDVGGLEKNVIGYASEKAAKLEEANIIIDDRGRIGLAEVTRIGMKEKEMGKIAELIAKVLVDQTSVEEVRAEIRQLIAKFQTDPLDIR